MTWRGETWDRNTRPLAADLPGVDVWASGILPTPAQVGNSSAVVVIAATASGSVAVVGSSSSAVAIVGAATASAAVVGLSSSVVVIVGVATADVSAIVSGSSAVVVVVVGEARGTIVFGTRADVTIGPVPALVAALTPMLTVLRATPLPAAGSVRAFTTMPSRQLSAPKRKR
jgi:phosphohistidine swiveling domain-containing protein